MKVNEMIPIIFGVLKNPKVIGTTIAMLLVIAFADFIVHYSKKPKASKPARTSPAKAPAADAGDTGPKPDMSEKDL